jgi:hypothetical protein
MLPPGVRYCVCYADQHRDHVGQVSVQGGQLLWSVLAGGKPRGWYSYVAVVRQGTNMVPIELQDEGLVRETVENGRAFYVVRGPREQRFEIEAASLIEAAAEGREYVDAALSTLH